ncbi:hypothetical protein C0J50_21975 [Silurus asotus]|uniref:Tetraspanin n=1 Tax=Silurus asotus TaxID=30991 RepID=A0AAD5FK33_SILAS|nr:hypothetical protein C0J50_21975 [Silurus asotus]
MLLLNVSTMFQLAGAAILGVGIWVTVDSSSMLGKLSQIDNAPPELAQLANVGYLLIAVGAILTIMGFLGCCGAITENKCMLLTFFIIVLLIFIAEVAGAIVILAFKPLAEEALNGLNKNFVEAIKKDYGENIDFTSVLNNTMIQAEKALNGLNENFVKNIKKDYGENDGFTSFLNNTMIQLNCCGYNNYTDFEGSPFEKSSNLFPKTCCNENTPCNQEKAKKQEVRGCFNALVKLIEDNAVLLGGVALGIAALEAGRGTLRKASPIDPDKGGPVSIAAEQEKIGRGPRQSSVLGRDQERVSGPRKDWKLSQALGRDQRWRGVHNEGRRPSNVYGGDRRPIDVHGGDQRPIDVHGRDRRRRDNLPGDLERSDVLGGYREHRGTLSRTLNRNREPLESSAVVRGTWRPDIFRRGTWRPDVFLRGTWGRAVDLKRTWGRAFDLRRTWGASLRPEEDLGSSLRPEEDLGASLRPEEDLGASLRPEED